MGSKESKQTKSFSGWLAAKEVSEQPQGKAKGSNPFAEKETPPCQSVWADAEQEQTKSHEQARSTDLLYTAEISQEVAIKGRRIKAVATVTTGVRKFGSQYK